jgi:hypothetical protein
VPPCRRPHRLDDPFVADPELTPDLGDRRWATEGLSQVVGGVLDGKVEVVDASGRTDVPALVAQVTLELGRTNLWARALARPSLASKRRSRTCGSRVSKYSA